MDFTRFGSSIPGEYWGCCAADIIQNFNQDPSTPASIQLVSGDGGGALTHGSGMAFAGPTLEDIFWTRLRVSTFSKRDAPDKAFFAILTEWQINSEVGKKWLAILKKAGFEFLRSVPNGTYTGTGIAQNPPTSAGSNLNHVFALFRQIGSGGTADPFTPPAAWTDLPKVTTEAWECIPEEKRKDVTLEQFTAHKKVWEDTGPTKILSEAEVEAAGAPVIMAGLRSMFPPQLKKDREEAMKLLTDKGVQYAPSSGTVSGKLYEPKEEASITLSPPATKV